MARSVDEWIGKTDDSAIPPKVKIRLFEAAKGRCKNCGVQIRPGNGPAYDHKKALVNGGENRESNLQILCINCHDAKTKKDVAEKSAVADKKGKHIGAKAKKPWGNGMKRKMDGTVIDARTGKVISRSLNLDEE